MTKLTPVGQAQASDLPSAHRVGATEVGPVGEVGRRRGTVACGASTSPQRVEEGSERRDRDELGSVDITIGGTHEVRAGVQLAAGVRLGSRLEEVCALRRARQTGVFLVVSTRLG